MRSIVPLLLGALVLTVNTPAQEKRPLNADPNVRAVHGVVESSDGEPVKGAVVKLEDTKSEQIRTYITDGDGGYHFAGLSTNVDYLIHAEHDGKTSASKRLSTFDSRKDAVENLKLR